VCRAEAPVATARVRHSAQPAGAKEVYMVAEPMLGDRRGLPVETPTAHGDDIGGGTTEIAVNRAVGHRSDTSDPHGR